MTSKPKGGKQSSLTKEVIEIGLEQITLEMSKLLKDFHQNLRNLSQMNLDRPQLRYKLDSNWKGSGLQLLPYVGSPKSITDSSNSTIASSKNDDKDSVKSNSTTSGRSSSTSSKVSGDHRRSQKPVQNKRGKSENRMPPKNDTIIKYRRPTTLAEELSEIKATVERAKQEKKTFTVCGNYQSIRKALLERGWVEKIRLSYNMRDRENLRKLQLMQIPELISKVKDKVIGGACRRVIMSKLLTGHQVDFYWDDFHDAFKVNNDKNKYTLINRFRRTIFSYTSKQGLCESLKRAHWYQKPGTSIIRHPRSYSLTNQGDPKDFIEDYKTTAAISLLKWVVATHKQQKAKLISESGKISLATFDFALNECLKVIKKAKHEDIDYEIEQAMDFQWNQFLDHYYKLVHIGGHFKGQKEESEHNVVQKAQYILNELEKYFPNLDMDGMMNIWILKPIAGCRGLGIHICRTLQYILQIVKTNTNMRYIIQKYIEKPLLIYNTKFDIRQWFLISSSCPLTIWIYKECYLRFSSQTYNLRKLHESIHLTNNSVQCKYKNTGRDVALPNYNMWDTKQFRNYLINIGFPKVYDKIIYPGMKQCITGAILLNQDNLDTRKNSFELYGADFMLTEDFQPWLIEINAKPALYASTPVTARMCPQVLEDLVKVIIDVPQKLKANTGNFELLYKQEIPKLPRVNAAKLKVEGTPLTRDYFCEPKTTETNMATLSKENMKLDEIQDYITKVNTEMNNALKNLLRIINNERNRRMQLTYGTEPEKPCKVEKKVEGKCKIEVLNVDEDEEQPAMLEEIHDSANNSPTSSEMSFDNDDSNVNVDKHGVLRSIVNFLKKYGSTTKNK